MIALVLTFAGSLPNVDGLLLLWVPPILAIVGVVNSGRWQLRTWVVSALVVNVACVVVLPVDVN